MGKLFTCCTLMKLPLYRRISGFLSIVAFYILLVPGQSAAQTTPIGSKASGNWHSTATWSGNAIPVAGSDVVINNVVTIRAGQTAEANNITIQSTGKLVVEGTLIVNGDLLMTFSGNDESELVMMSGSATVVKGNVHLTNKVSLNLSSYLVIMGNLTKDGSAQQGDIVIQDASIYVFGTVDSQNTGIIPCDSYDNLTTNNSETCHAGTVDAFVDNTDNHTIPGNVIAIVSDCEPPVIANPGNKSSCGSYTLPVITGTNLSGNESYYTGPGGTGTAYLAGQSVVATTTLYIYDRNGICSDEEIFQVNINPYPLTGEINAD